MADRPGFTYLDESILAFILGLKSGQFLCIGDRHYIHHLYGYCTRSECFPYGCGVLFI